MVINKSYLIKINDKNSKSNEASVHIRQKYICYCPNWTTLGLGATLILYHN